MRTSVLIVLAVVIAVAYAQTGCMSDSDCNSHDPNCHTGHFCEIHGHHGECKCRTTGKRASDTCTTAGSTDECSAHTCHGHHGNATATCVQRGSDDHPHLLCECLHD